MCDHRKLRTLSIENFFSDLKEYEFDMMAQLDEDKEERSTTLVTLLNNHPLLLGRTSDN